MAGFQEKHDVLNSFGIDLGKTTLHLVVLGAAGKVLVKKEFTQKQLLTYTGLRGMAGNRAATGLHWWQCPAVQYQ